MTPSKKKSMHASDDNILSGEEKLNVSSILDVDYDLGAGTKGSADKSELVPDHQEDHVTTRDTGIIRKSTEATSLKQSQGYQSPKPIENYIGETTLHLSHDINTLAQLYHSSRRSRHDSPQRSTKSVMVLPYTPPPPLVHQGRQISGDSNAIKKTGHSEWVFGIVAPIPHESGPSSDSSVDVSICSTNAEDLMSCSALTACDSVGEVGATEPQLKKRKVNPEE